MKKFLHPIFQTLFIALILFFFSSCGSDDKAGDTAATGRLAVYYDGNGNSGGFVPVDSNRYTENQTVTVLGNPNNLTLSGFTFIGWNTETDGSGVTYTQGATFNIGSADITLYAMWSANPTYTVTYDGNGNTSGFPPTDSNNYEANQVVTVLGNTNNLSRSGLKFIGWNTDPSGAGINYAVSDNLIMGSANLTLYALWGGICAGIAGLQCPSGQICDISDACNNSDPAGTCVIDPITCDTTVDEVCGCNGITYLNDCQRIKAGISLDHTGPC